MTFKEVLDSFLAGFKIRRESWELNKSVGLLEFGNKYQYLTIYHNNTPSVFPSSFNSDELKATDWEILT